MNFQSPRSLPKLLPKGTKKNLGPKFFLSEFKIFELKSFLGDSKLAISQNEIERDTMHSCFYFIFSQAHCNLIAGGCMALALRFAGSANQPAFETMVR